LFRSDVLKKIGLFDEEMWMYNEDQDLGWRVWLAGYKCILAPDAIVYHKYEFSRSIAKYYWMDRNRIIAILKNYRLGTLVLIFPAFVIMGLGLIMFAIKGGWIKEKIKVWEYFLNVKNWRYILRARKEVQGLRKVKDRDIIPMFSGKIWYQEIDDVKLRLVNPIFNAYWWLVKKIIFW
jgi:GT2 family glycosyltransferase